MTLFAITNFHWPICLMICFIPFVRLRCRFHGKSILALTMGKSEACSAERALAIVRMRLLLNGSASYSLAAELLRYGLKFLSVTEILNHNATVLLLAIVQKRAHANNRERSLC
jgi:hypothetical protein